MIIAIIAIITYNSYRYCVHNVIYKTLTNVPALSCRKVQQVISWLSVLYLHSLFNPLKAVSSTYLLLYTYTLIISYSYLYPQSYSLLCLYLLYLYFVSCTYLTSSCVPIYRILVSFTHTFYSQPPMPMYIELLTTQVYSAVPVTHLLQQDTFELQLEWCLY